MDFKILGPLEVAEEGRPLELGGSRQRQLLAILLLHRNEVVSSDRLIDHLWGAEPPPTAAKSLQAHVSRLRKALGAGGSLATHGSGYRLSAGVDDIDAARFERQVEGGRGRLSAGDAAGAAADLHEALQLWRGPPLSDFAYEAFAQAEIVRLEELRMTALEERIEANLALGRHAGLVGELEALVTEYPLRERLRAQLMLALYRSGRQAEALAAYQDARLALVEELGLEPSRTLQDVEQAILRHDPALDLAGGAPISPPDPDLGRPRAPPPKPGPERKLATVLFVDLVGPTARGEQDPERFRALLERYYDAASAEIEAAGGTVGTFAGDAILATFGAPAALEDHAERALHAALAVRSRCEELFAGAIALHLGVNTGEVVVGRAGEGSFFVTGDAVNVAARLEQAAEEGEILVGERTASAARGAFEFGEPATAPAEGKADGVAGRRLIRALAATRPRGVAGLRSSFVGRQRELDLLQATYRRAVEGREPHLVTIVGDAGVGKTSLVGALWGRLEHESPEPGRHAGRCLPYGRGVTYWPLGEVLKSHLAILGSDPEEVVRARLGEREILAVTLGLEPPSGLHPLVARERLHTGWVAFLEELVAERPAAVLVEDIHCAEQLLLDLLDRLRREVAGPLLLVATARPELLDRRPDWGAGGRNTTQLWLEPLSSQDAEQMLEELLEAELPARLRRLVLERAEGNPFYLEELLATFIDRGLLERNSGGGWIARDPPTDFAIPDSLQSVLAARIDLLDPTAKAALEAAAVVGRVFWAGPVAELLGGVEIDWLALEERDFVCRRPGSTLAGEREFGFKHTLTREVAYSSLPKARRGPLHAVFAAWVERLGDGRDEHAPLLAHHYAEAVRPEDVDLAWPGEEEEVEWLRAKALLWLRRAAGLAGARYALDEQIGLLGRAVELEPDTAELWHAIAQAHARKYDQGGFRTAMLGAIELSNDADAAELYGELAFWDAFRWAHAEDRELIESWIERALDLAAPASPARARALVARSYCHPEEAEAAAREACAIAEGLTDVDLRSYAYHASADAALAAGRYDEAREWAERRLELLDRISDPDHVADVYWSAIPGYLGRGRFAEARRLAELHDEVTSGLSPHHRLHGVAFLLEIEELGGNWEMIRELTERAEQAVEASTPCVHRPRSLVVCALGAACLGEEEEARRLESLADELDAEEYGRVVDARLRLALVRGDLERTERLLAESERPAKTLFRSTKLAPAAARIDALLALRRRETLEEEAPPLVQAETYLEPFALRALGLLREDPILLEQAAERFDAMTLAWYAAQTREMLVGML
jgi:DNA-binding SARP family transcriptional activator/class 3 adenylate cyclase